METVWWFLKQFHNKELAVQRLHHSAVLTKSGNRLIFARTQPTGTIVMFTDTTVVAQFKVKKLCQQVASKIEGLYNQLKAAILLKTPAVALCIGLNSTMKNEQPIHILAWTTTPWTYLPTPR